MWGDADLDSVYSRFSDFASEARWVKRRDTLYATPLRIMLDMRCITMDPDTHRTISIDLGAAHNDTLPCQTGWGTQDFEWHTRIITPLSCLPGISGVNQIWLTLQIFPYDTSVHGGRGEYLLDNLRFDYGNGDLVAVDMFGDPLVGVAEIPELPSWYRLVQNYPNPFNPITTIEFSLPHAGHVILKVYNVLGEEVATLIAGDHAAGTFRTTQDASGMPSGVYFYRLISGGHVQNAEWF